MIEDFKTTSYYISSSGSGLSLSIQGLSLIGLTTAIFAISNLLGLGLAESEISSALFVISFAISFAITGYGLLRKLYYRIQPLIE